MKELGSKDFKLTPEIRQAHRNYCGGLMTLCEVITLRKYSREKEAERLVDIVQNDLTCFDEPSDGVFPGLKHFYGYNPDLDYVRQVAASLKQGRDLVNDETYVRLRELHEAASFSGR